MSERIAEHKRDKKSFVKVLFIKVKDRISSRNLEGSALAHAPVGLNNAPKPVSEGYYHAYNKDNLATNRTFYEKDELNKKIKKEGTTKCYKDIKKDNDC